MGFGPWPGRWGRQSSLGARGGVVGPRRWPGLAASPGASTWCFCAARGRVCFAGRTSPSSTAFLRAWEAVTGMAPKVASRPLLTTCGIAGDGS